MRRLLRWLGIGAGGIAAVLAAALALAPYADGPVGPIPGGPLSGPVEEREPDWSAIASRDSLELQVNERDPRSLTVWLLVLDGELYVPAGFAERKRWPAQTVADPRVVIRIDGVLYERRAQRVTDPGLRAALFTALADKYPVPAGEDPGTWFFHLGARTS